MRPIVRFWADILTTHNHPKGPQKLIPWLSSNPADLRFPDTKTAQKEPNGLLAAGGDLSVKRLQAAYRLGIFPWFSDGEPILWWSPDPRAVLRPAEFHCSRSLRRQLKKTDYEVCFDRAFADVMRGCAAPRYPVADTWITDEMFSAYQALHAAGFAHSIEVRRAGKLIGGLYGVCIGRMFFGESMFSAERDGSKIAMAWLCKQLEKWGFSAIDCQVENSHTNSLGARNIDRSEFETLLQQATSEASIESPWTIDISQSDFC